jgi:hypothetical protein
MAISIIRTRLYNPTPIMYNLVLIIYKKIWIHIKRTKARTRFIYNRGRIMYKKGGNQKKGAKFGTFLKILNIKKPESPCWSDIRVTMAPFAGVP